MIVAVMRDHIDRATIQLQLDLNPWNSWKYLSGLKCLRVEIPRWKFVFMSSPLMKFEIKKITNGNGTEMFPMTEGALSWRGPLGLENKASLLLSSQTSDQARILKIHGIAFTICITFLFSKHLYIVSPASMSLPKPQELILAYRQLYRGVLHAVQYAKPQRYVARDQLRKAFRRETPSTFDQEKIKKTVEFLRLAAKENGLEHKILKNLLHTEFEQRAAHLEYAFSKPS